MIRLENLTKSYGQKNLFSDVSFHFPEGEKIALIGPNGAGKSTLLNILAMKEECDLGKVLFPSEMTLAYLPQEPNPTPEETVILECEAGHPRLKVLTKDLARLLITIETDCSQETLSEYEETESMYRAEGGYELRSKAQGILSGLGFSQTVCQSSPMKLSGGWRMRLELAKLFVQQPDFLILDEPTNHLDLPSLMWVENYLRSYTKTLLFVSHDRALLNRLATVTVDLSQGTLTAYKGNFDAHIEAKKIRDSQDAAQQVQVQKQKDHLESFINRFGAKASKAKQAQSRAKSLEKLNESHPSTAKESTKTLHFQLPTPLRSPRVVATIENGGIGYEKILASKIQLLVERQQKIAVIGANGIGKSTLLKTLIGKMIPLSGNFCLHQGVQTTFFAQDQLETLDENMSILKNIQTGSALGEPQIRSILGGFLFHGDDVHKEVKVLSGGEKSRVGLALILSRPANFLALDEPSNHLDMASAHSLAQALLEYSGTLIFVSHDRDLINTVCTHIFAMLPDGRSMLFEGQLNDYERQAKLAGFPNVLEIDSQVSKKNADKNKRQSDHSPSNSQDVRKLKKQLQALKKKINSYDKKISGHKETLSSEEKNMISISPNDFKELSASNARHALATHELEINESLWLDAQSELEEIEAQLKGVGRL